LNKTQALEKLAQVLTVVSFLVICWVAHRVLAIRTQCVSSSFVAYVQIGQERVENCLFESRLSLSRLFRPLSSEHIEMLRALEVLEPLAQVLPVNQPRLAVEINLKVPYIFELGRGYVRIGQEWLSDGVQTRRALIMGVLKRQFPKTYNPGLQIEVVTDFLLSAVFGENDWGGHSLLQEARFPTSSPGFAEYCKSPFRSLAHFDECVNGAPAKGDPHATVWGFRSLLAAGMVRVFNKASIGGKMAVIHALAQGRAPAPILGLSDSSIEARVRWLERSLTQQATAFGFEPGAETDLAVQRTLKELDVSAPTHWELTVDLTNTPSWKEVLEQFRQWTRLHARERVLVFTPEGAIAFPAGLPVEWAAHEVQSQKHVLIACHWPKPEDALPVTARHMFARQLCGKIDEVFWN